MKRSTLVIFLFLEEIIFSSFWPPYPRECKGCTFSHSLWPGGWKSEAILIKQEGIIYKREESFIREGQKDGLRKAF
jgi:hypothetical protein